MSYYTRARRPKPVTISTKAAEDMIEFLLKVEGMSEWESSFVTSLKAGWKKYGSVTEKQHSQIQKLVDRHTPEKILARAEWTEGYSETMRTHARIAARYYKANPPYFGDLADRVLEDPTFVPSERAYTVNRGTPTIPGWNHGRRTIVKPRPSDPPRPNCFDHRAPYGRPQFGQRSPPRGRAAHGLV